MNTPPTAIYENVVGYYTVSVCEMIFIFLPAETQIITEVAFIFPFQIELHQNMTSRIPSITWVVSKVHELQFRVCDLVELRRYDLAIEQ